MNTTISRTGMTAARWEYLKAVRPAEPRFVHLSAEIVRNPAAFLAEVNKKPFFGPQYIVGRRWTYNVGRNKAKRERRAALAKAVQP